MPDIDYKKNQIFVEGKDDRKFIEVYLEHLNINDVEVHFVNGKYGLKGENADIAQVLDNGRKVAIIFDANSNYKESKKNITSQIKAPYDKKVNIFLFPNNEDKGSLETLLANLIKHKNIICCFEEYQKCIEGLGHPPPDDKAKIYAYQEALGEQGRGFQKFESKNWRFDAEYAQRLKKFLKQFSGRS